MHRPNRVELAGGHSAEFGIKDVDLVYFDPNDLSEETETAHEKRLRAYFRDLPVKLDVKNEARVHLWYDRFGTTGSLAIRSRHIARPPTPSRASPPLQLPSVYVGHAAHYMRTDWAILKLPRRRAKRSKPITAGTGVSRPADRSRDDLLRVPGMSWRTSLALLRSSPNVSS
jgi:hypothetical protein